MGYTSHNTPTILRRPITLVMTVITVIALIVPAAHGQFVGRWTQPAPTPSPTPIAGTDNTLIQDVEKNKPLYASQYNAIINATNAFIDGWVLSSDTLNHATYNGIITHNRDRMSGATFAITDTLQINNKLTTNNRLFGAAQTTRPHIWNKIISKNDRIFDTSPTAIPHVWHTAGVMHIIAGALANLTGNPILIHNHLAQPLAGGGTADDAIIQIPIICISLFMTCRYIDIDNAIAATGGHLSTSPRHFRTDRGFATDHPDIVIASGDDTSTGIDSALQMVDFASGTVSQRLQTNPCNNTGSLILAYPYGTNPDGSLRCRSFPNAPTP